MNYNQSQKAIQEILKLNNERLLKQYVTKALRYVTLRVNWYLGDQEQRTEMDEERTRAHNVFIDFCNIISREMHKQGLDNSWRKNLGENRKVIGDFACCLIAEIGIKAR